MEIEALFRDITQTMVKYGVIPRKYGPIPLPDPVNYIGQWVRNHPDEAVQMATVIRDRVAKT
jgi:hypothetical protein